MRSHQVSAIAALLSFLLTVSCHGFALALPWLRLERRRNWTWQQREWIVACWKQSPPNRWRVGRQNVKLQLATGAGAAGGGSASVIAAVGGMTGDKYFIKSAPLSRGGEKTLRAEYL